MKEIFKTSIVVAATALLTYMLLNGIYGNKEYSLDAFLVSLQDMCKGDNTGNSNFFNRKYHFGIDLAHTVGDVDWQNLEADQPIKFVVLRATRGVDIDNLYAHHEPLVRENGFIFGAYHYYRPNEYSGDQAKNYINTVTLLPGDLLPVLDIEELPNPKVQSVPKMITGLKNWIAIITEHYGVEPIIYSNYGFYMSHLVDSFPADQYKLWLAGYSSFRWPEIAEYSQFIQYTQDLMIMGCKEPLDGNYIHRRYLHKYRIPTKQNKLSKIKKLLFSREEGFYFWVIHYPKYPLSRHESIF